VSGRTGGGVRAVVFDLWGTLVDLFSDEAHFRLMSEMAELVGVDAETFTRGWADSYDDRMRGGTLEEHVGRLARAGVDVTPAVRRRVEHVRSLLRFRPDVVPTLEALRARGLRTGLISICSTEVEEVVAAGELAPLFDVAFYSCSQEITKPDPRAFTLASEQLGVPAEACLFVDDTVVNLFGAEEAGMRAVQIGDREGWPGERIEQIGDVLDLVTRRAA
jgi:putative hydrolase of the HAD superfamily